MLNPRTLRVSPQFHIVFDDEFLTVPFMQNGEIPPHWSELVNCASVLATDEDFDLATSWANDFISNNPVAVNKVHQGHLWFLMVKLQPTGSPRKQIKLGSPRKEFKLGNPRKVLK